MTDMVRQIYDGEVACLDLTKMGGAQPSSDKEGHLQDYFGLCSELILIDLYWSFTPG